MRRPVGWIRPSEEPSKQSRENRGFRGGEGRPATGRTLGIVIRGTGALGDQHQGVDPRRGTGIVRGGVRPQTTPRVFVSGRRIARQSPSFSAFVCPPGMPEGERKALTEGDRPCTELRNRNRMMTIRVGMSWAAAHDCRKSPAYESGVSVVGANRPVPLVAGEPGTARMKRSKVDRYGPAAAQQMSSNALKGRRRHMVLRSIEVSSSVGLSK